MASFYNQSELRILLDRFPEGPGTDFIRVSGILKQRGIDLDIYE